MSIILLIAYVLTTSGGLILIKLGTASGLPVSIVDNALKFNLNPNTVIGIVLYGLSFILYVYLISKFDLGYIIPLTTALVYAVIFTASFFIFHEVFTVLKIAAISFIVLGVILLNLK